MTDIKHTKECEAAQEAVSEYREKWPQHCTACGGWGFVTSRGDSVPYGSTYVSLPDYQEPCDYCETRNLCPRCGTEREWIEDGKEDPSDYHADCPGCGLHCPSCFPVEPENEGSTCVECYCWEFLGDDYPRLY